MPPSSDPVRPAIPDAEIVPDRVTAAASAGSGSPPAGFGGTAAGTTGQGAPLPGTPGFASPAFDAPASAGPRFGGPGYGAQGSYAPGLGGSNDGTAARSGRLGATLGGLALLGVVLEAGALAYGWTHPQVPAAVTQDAARVQGLDSQVQAAKQQRDGLAAELDKVQARLAVVEGRPSANLTPIEQRLATLEKPAPVASTDISELARRLDSIAGRQDQLAARQQADVNTLSGRTDAATAQATAAGAGAVAALGRQLDAAQATLGKQIEAAESSDKAARDTLASSLSGRIDAATAQAAAAATALTTALGGRIDAAQSTLAKRIDDGQAGDKTARDALAASLGGRINAGAAQDAKALAELSGKVGALDARLVTVEQSSGKVAGLAARAGTMAQLQSAQDNLAAGHKLGTIAGAPPALARFATVAPPTEAALRLSFADAAEAARQASQPQNARRPFLGRVWSRVQQAVVVRQGDDVIVGDPAAGVLARAGDAMNAGDLPGTVEIAETLQGPARESMGPWLAQAHQLLDARAALASLVAHS